LKAKEREMKKLIILICIFLWLGCGGKKNAEQKGQDEEPNVVELSSGVTVEVPSGVLQQKKIGSTTHVRIKEQNLVYTFVTQSAAELDPNKSCEQQLLDSIEKLKQARSEDFNKLMETRSEKRCDLHDSCLLLEIGQRNPDEYKAGKPFREIISYSVCLGEQFIVLMGLLLPSGTPVTDANRAVMKQVVQSLKSTEKP
jgi:hypothetical protein